jgi:hypothetical protein
MLRKYSSIHYTSVVYPDASEFEIILGSKIEILASCIFSVTAPPRKEKMYYYKKSCAHQFTADFHIRLVNLRRRSGVSVRVRDSSDYRLDRIEGAAIADPETGSSPGNLLTAMHSGSSANCSSQKI